MKMIRLSLKGVLFFVILFFSAFVEGSKRGFNEALEDGEVLEADMRRDIKKTRNNEADDFVFNFFPDSKVQDEAKRKEAALAAFVDCNEKAIDRLMEEEYDIFGSGVWDKLVEIRSYESIKYILDEHIQDASVIRKMFKMTIIQGLTSLFRFMLNNFKLTVMQNSSRFVVTAFNNERYKLLRMMAKEGFKGHVVLPSKNEKCLLHMAVISDNLQLVKIMLRFDDIKVNHGDLKGNTPLHYAKSVEIIKLLMEHGALTTYENDNYKTPVDIAIATYNHDLVVAMLPSLTARLNHFYRAMVPGFYIPVSRTFKIDRQRVLEDSAYLAMGEANWYKRESIFKINFRGETGVDQGGLTREWFSLLISRFFIPRLAEEQPVEEVSVSERTIVTSSASSSSAATAAPVQENTHEIESEEDRSGVIHEHVIPNEPHFDSDPYDVDADEESANIVFLQDDESEESGFNIMDYLVDSTPTPSIPSLLIRRGSLYNPAIREIPDEYISTYYGAPFECVDEGNKLYKISNKFTGPVFVYKFIGSIVAKAMLQKVPLQVKLVPSLFKLIMGKNLTFEDLEDDDRVMYQSMLHCLADDFDFQAAQYSMPSNDDVMVDRSNVMEFLDETAVEAMYQRQKPAIDEFVRGFKSILSQGKLRAYFTPSELQTVLLGSTTIDRNDLFNCIEIRGLFWKANKALFWTGIQELNDAELIELVRFITGINGLPFGGVSSLKRNIQVFDGNISLYPRASTCNFSINLPVTIGTPEELVEMFRIAISSDPEFNDALCCL